MLYHVYKNNILIFYKKNSFTRKIIVRERTRTLLKLSNENNNLIRM